MESFFGPEILKSEPLAEPGQEGVLPHLKKSRGLWRVDPLQSSLAGT